MGAACCGGSTSAFHTEFVVEFNRFATLFTRLRLNQLECRNLYQYFRTIDSDNSGRISMEEFRGKIKLDDTPFASRVFTLFDYDGSGMIDFGEFVSVLWNYCTFSKYGLLALAFNLYDADASGELDIGEVEEIVRQVYGIRGEIVDARLLEALTAMCGPYAKLIDRDQTVTRDQFEAFAIEHPSILQPAMDMQTDLRMAVLGTPFWEALTVRRQGSSDMSNVADFVVQLKRDRAKTFGAAFGSAAAASTVSAARRRDAMDRIQRERAAHKALFGDGTLQEADDQEKVLESERARSKRKLKKRKKRKRRKHRKQSKDDDSKEAPS